jgi:hypothetical protein
MDLRDSFAAHFAAALVDAFADAEHVARRAYDLADAMLAERARRVDADEEGAILFEPLRGSLSAPPLEAPPLEARPLSAPPPASEPPAWHGALLDQPHPIFDPDLGYDDEDLDPSLLEPPYDPSWDLDAHLITPSRPPGPGLVRTQPEEEPARKERAG